MTREKILSERLQIKVDAPTLELCRALAAALGLGMSSTVRYLVHEKARVLGVTAPVAAKKKRRAAP